MKKFIPLILIILLALLLRLYSLGSLPAINADEAAIGYNAYSLLETGKDEHGNSWPLHFQSFNDWKPGLYFYIVLPFVKVLGLNVWSIRLPSVLMGVGTVFLIYFLANKIFENKKIKLGLFEINIGHISSLFLAISPWHIHFSRGGWEVNVSTFFVTLAVLLFIIFSQNKRFGILFLSVFFFVLSMYTYHSARIISPLMGLGLLVLYFKHLELIKNLKKFAIIFVIQIVLLIPLLLSLTSPAGLSRASGVGILADVGPYNRINEQRGEHENLNSLPSKIIHNKLVNYSLLFLQNWGKHYWGEFLFLSGDAIQRDKVPETGQMYLFDIILVPIGIFFLLRKFDKGEKLVLYWILIAPIAASLTFQSPHALRSHLMVIPLILASSLGLFFIIDKVGKIQNIKAVKMLYLIIAVLISLQFARYTHMYFVHLAKEYPYSSQYGLNELTDYVNDNQYKYEKIVVTDKFDQPYILFLYYLKYSPKQFQNEHTLTPRDKFGFSTVTSFGKYIFTSIDFDKDKEKYKKSLIVGTQEEIPDAANVIKRINFPNGEVAFKIVAN